VRVAGPKHIAAVDPQMARAIKAVGACALPQRRGRYAALVRAIIGQQVSAKSAQSTYNKLRAAAGGHVTPERVGALTTDELRACGLSRQKLGYIVDLTAKVRDGHVRLDRLPGMDDDDIVESLTQVKGIGEWTAHMFLIFVLNRPDVLAVGDLAIQNGFMRVYGLRERPSAEEMHALAAPWRPYRTIGCWYLWRSLDALPA